MSKKILIIDDDPDFLDWIVTGLTRDDFKIVAAQSAAGGLALARAELPDLAIVDISLPDRDGFSVCRDLKSSPDLPGIRVMLITGMFKEIEYKERGYQAGADDFLVKPFSYDQLRVRVIHQLAK